MSFKNAANSGGEDLFTIIVETLTGTTFEVKVSPQDTVKSIKTKIQRVEGIPVSHQHLVYNSRELEDAACVTEPSIALHDGATVQLVLSMRGGPISLVHQPVPLNRTLLRSLVRFSREDAIEDLPPGCRMAILVLRVGDQLNLLHVVEDDEDSDSPSSCRDPSLDLLEGDLSKNMEENSVTMEKVCDLKERMGKLSLQRKSKKSESKSKDASSVTCAVEEESSSKPGSSLKLPSLSHQVQGEILKSRSEFSQVPILPDIIPQNTSAELEEVISLDGATASSQICDSMRPKSCPSAVTESQFFDVFGEDGCEDNVQIAQPHFRCISACASKIRHEWGINFSGLNILPPIAGVSDIMNNNRKVSNIEPRNSQTSSVPFIENLNIHHKNLNSTIKLKQNLKSALKTSKGSSFLSRNISPSEGTHSDAFIKDSSYNFTTEYSSSTNFELLPKVSNVSPAPTTLMEPSSSGLTVEHSKRISLNPSLSRKVDFDKKSRIRCAECKKRLSLAGMFECRCGFTFCSFHRYSETHHCTYDFKKENRKVLEQANPLVVAPKLPKI